MTLLIFHGTGGSAILALILGLGASLGLRLIKHRMITLIFTLLIGGILLLPTYGPTIVQSDHMVKNLHGLSQTRGVISFSHRLYIWGFTSEKIKQNFPYGSGLGQSRNIQDGDTKILDHPKISLEKWGNNSLLSGFQRMEILPLHPHNFILQIWLELGLTGAIVLALGLFYFARSLYQDSKHTVSLLPVLFKLGGFISFFTIASLSYSIWQSWWLASIGFVLCLYAMAQKKQGYDD
jgi:O-antigen ligase